MRIARDVEIDAPADVVWGVTLDLVGLGAGVPGRGRAEVLDPGPIRPGTRVLVEQLGLPARVWTVEDFVWPSFVSWTTPLAGGVVRAVHVVAPDGRDRSRLTLRIDVEGGAAPAIGALGAPLLRRVLQSEALTFGLAAAAASGP